MGLCSSKDEIVEEAQPLGLIEIIGDTFVSRDGQNVSYNDRIEGNKLIAIYFSAHWCPVCTIIQYVLRQLTYM